MMTLSEYCNTSTTDELHDMLRQVNEKYRWERTEASHKLVQEVIKELKKRDAIVQTS